MAIPKRYKKQVKAAMSGNKTATRVRKPASSTPKKKRTWSLRIGDLVENGDDCAIIIDSNDDGYYLILSSTGRRWERATKLHRVQKAPRFSGACKVE